MSRSHTTAASLFGHFAFLVSFSAALANLSCKQLGLKQKSHSRTRFHMLLGFDFNQNQSNMNLFLNSTCAKLQGLKFFDESLGLCVGPSTSAKAWWPLQSTACPESLALFSTKFSKANNGRKRSLGFLNGFAQGFPRLPSPSPKSVAQNGWSQAERLEARSFPSLLVQGRILFLHCMEQPAAVRLPKKVAPSVDSWKSSWPRNPRTTRDGSKNRAQWSSQKYWQNPNLTKIRC